MEGDLPFIPFLEHLIYESTYNLKPASLFFDIH